MTVRQGLPLGAKRTQSAKKPTFRALVQQDFKLRHYRIYSLSALD